MKKIFVIMFVTGPLGLAIIVIINGIMSETLPLFKEQVNNSQFLEQTYEAAKEYCENLKNSTVNQERSYSQCMNSVEEWFEENPYK